MDFQTSIRTCFNKYVVFSGRASLSEYWWFALFLFAGSVLTALVSDVLNSLFALGVFLPALAAAVRRFHDTGKSGWWVLIWLIPLIGWIIGLYLLAQPSEEGANDYGPEPEEAAAYRAKRKAA